jgi:hypothetical protein
MGAGPSLAQACETRPTLRWKQSGASQCQLTAHGSKMMWPSSVKEEVYTATGKPLPSGKLT